MRRRDKSPARDADRDLPLDEPPTGGGRARVTRGLGALRQAVQAAWVSPGNATAPVTSSSLASPRPTRAPFAATRVPPTRLLLNPLVWLLWFLDWLAWLALVFVRKQWADRFIARWGANGQKQKLRSVGITEHRGGRVFSSRVRVAGPLKLHPHAGFSGHDDRRLLRDGGEGSGDGTGEVMVGAAASMAAMGRGGDDDNDDDDDDSRGGTSGAARGGSHAGPTPTVHAVLQRAFASYGKLPCLGTRAFLRMHSSASDRFPRKVRGARCKFGGRLCESGPRIYCSRYLAWLREAST